MQCSTYTLDHFGTQDLAIWTICLIFFSLIPLNIAAKPVKVPPKLPSTPSIPKTKQAVPNEQQQHCFKIAILSLLWSLESDYGYRFTLIPNSIGRLKDFLDT